MPSSVHKNNCTIVYNDSCNPKHFSSMSKLPYKISLSEMLHIADGLFTMYVLASRGENLHSTAAHWPGIISPIGFRHSKMAWSKFSCNNTTYKLSSEQVSSNQRTIAMLQPTSFIFHSTWLLKMEKIIVTCYLQNTATHHCSIADILV